MPGPQACKRVEMRIGGIQNQIATMQASSAGLHQDSK